MDIDEIYVKKIYVFYRYAALLEIIPKSSHIKQYVIATFTSATDRNYILLCVL